MSFCSLPHPLKLRRSSRRPNSRLQIEALDFYMSSHPLAQHDEQLRRFRAEAAELLGVEKKKD